MTKSSPEYIRDYNIEQSGLRAEETFRKKNELTTQQKKYATLWLKDEIHKKSIDETMQKFFYMANTEVIEMFANDEFDKKEKLFIWQVLCKYVLPEAIDLNLNKSTIGGELQKALTMPYSHVPVEEKVLIEPPPRIVEMITE